jgi:hypothetical protein
VSDRPLVGVVGSGLAGLAAAVSVVEAGGEVVVFDQARTPGGATRESAGWIWRYRDLEMFRAAAPFGDSELQQLVHGRFDSDLAWLEGLGVRILSAETGRSFTTGARVDPGQLVEALVRRLPSDALRLDTRIEGARASGNGRIELRITDLVETWETVDHVVFAGGGYAADTQRIAAQAQVEETVRARWRVRPLNGGDGSSQAAAVALGATFTGAVPGESFVRLVAAGATPTAHLLRGIGELQLPGTRLVDADGEEVVRQRHDWSGAQSGWELARRTGAGRIELPRAVLRERVHAGRVEDIVRAAADAGAEVVRTEGGVSVTVAAGLTHTLNGLRIDAGARVLRDAGRLRRRSEPIPRVLAAGCDAVGAGAGGYASGLAQALVTGRVAAESALR